MNIFIFIVNICLLTWASFSWAFTDLYEIGQQELAEDNNENDLIANAMRLIFKMKNGIGGITVAKHYPSERTFIHRNKWIMECNANVSLENGHCGEDSVEPLVLFKPKKSSDFCFIKVYTTINETLCLSTHPINMTVVNDTVKCESASGNDPIQLITIDEHIKLCENISNNVTYIYYPNNDDPEHVEIPNENTHVKCEIEETKKEEKIQKDPKEQKGQGKKKTKDFKLRPALNRTGVCVFTETENFRLHLLDYLQT